MLRLLFLRWLGRWLHVLLAGLASGSLELGLGLSLGTINKQVRQHVTTGKK